MKVEIKHINLNDVSKAAETLAQSFVEDKGMKALFHKDERGYKKKLLNWFLASLKMHLKNRQLTWGAYIEDNLIGVALTSHSSFTPKGFSMLEWTFSIFMRCGIKTIFKTILHDQKRRKHFTQKNQVVLEFIGVDSDFRRKGIGKLLLEHLLEHSQKRSFTVWLETTKPVNIEIFKKSGFKLVSKFSEFGVEYFIMISE